MLLLLSYTVFLWRILASPEIVDVFVVVVVDVFVVVVGDVFVGVVLDILTACVGCGFVTNVLKALDVVDSVVVVWDFLAFVKMGKSKNVLKGSNRAGKAPNWWTS